MSPDAPRQPAAETPHQPSWINPVKPVVPDHELLRRVGGGSYGDVWLARNIMGTWRAVKVVFRDRFLDARPYEREFNGIQKFEPLSRSNEGFIDILQIGRNDAEGYFYYVMELADDASDLTEFKPETYVPKTLSKALFRSGRLPVSACLELGITLNLALAHLHNAGLIHRDIKPSNIIFVGGVPKLADIGLVIEVAEARSYVGTEGFIPPEGPNSPMADLYSLGKVLYEAGMGKDRKDFPEPPTQIAEVPDSAELLEFNAVLLKACAANVKDRYQSAEEMNADLALLQSGGSVRRQRTLTRRLRSVQRAGALVTALAAVIGAGWLWQARQTRIVRELGVEKTRLADEKTRLANETLKQAEENRERVVRLDIANGVRLMDQDDPSGALLWFADALPLVTNHPAELAMHRVRIQQALNQVPRLLQLIDHGAAVLEASFSPKERTVAAITYGYAPRVWEAATGEVWWKLGEDYDTCWQVRFSRDGHRLLVSSCTDQAGASSSIPPPELQLQCAEVLDAETGKAIFPRIRSNIFWTAFSPDDRWLAVARTNHSIEVFSTTDGKQVVELNGQTNTIRMVTFSPDGNLLACAGRDHSVGVWSLPSGQPFGPGLLHDRPLLRLVFGPDSRLIATCTDAANDEPSFTQIWDAASGQKVGPQLTTTGCLFMISFVPGGPGRFVWSGLDRKIHVRDIDSGTELFDPVTMAGYAESWAVSPDGRSIAVGSRDSRVYILSLESGKSLYPPVRHNGYVMSVHFSDDGSRLLTASDEGAVRIWELPRSTESARLLLSTNIITGLPEDNRPRGRTRGPIPIKLEDDELHLVEPDRLVELQAPRFEGRLTPNNLRWEEGVSGKCWAQVDGWKLSDADSPQKVTVWHLEQGRFRPVYLNHPQSVYRMAFCAGDTRFITLCVDREARIWNPANGELIRSVHIAEKYRWADLLILPQTIRGDGTAVLVALVTPNERASYQLFGLATGELVGKPFKLLPSMDLEKVRLSPDGTRLATVGFDQMGYIIGLLDGRLACPGFRPGGDLTDVDWSPDGRFVVTAGQTEEVKIWDATTGQMVIAPMVSGNNFARAARWSADGRFVVTRCDDNTARVWDAMRTEPVTPSLRHAGYIRFACVTPNQRLITASDPNLIRAWDLAETKLSSEVIADYAHLLSGRKLSPSGLLLPITPAELQRLQRSLQDRAPELFTAP